MSLLNALRKGARAGALPLLLLALFLVASRGALEAQIGHRAGLVIVHGDGRVTTRCVTFEEDTITGLSLLQRAGLGLEIASGAGGATVCSIEGQGCPAADCFCQCQGSPCAYWNYFYRAQGSGWAYSALGAVGRSVRPGDVDGWVWGDGSSPPPDLDVAAICGASSPTTQPPATATSAATVPAAAASATTEPQAATPEPQAATPEPQTSTPEPPTPTPRPTETATPTVTSPTTETTPDPSITPHATATSTSTPRPEPTPKPTAPPASERATESEPFPYPYAVFAVLIVVLGGAFWWVKQRGG